MNIYETITKIIGEIPAIGKDRVNQQQKFKYRGIDDVMNAMQPLLAKYKLFIAPEILEQIREERQTKLGGTLIYSICKIKYTFYAEDGSFITAITIGEGMDSGDKATNKAMAIAMKYALFQVFCIPTDEMKDPDGETPPEILTKGNEKINDIKVQALEKAIKNKNISNNKVTEVLKKFNYKSITDISVADYMNVCNAFKEA
jgi:hypothetical protein